VWDPQTAAAASAHNSSSSATSSTAAGGGSDGGGGGVGVGGADAPSTPGSTQEEVSGTVAQGGYADDAASIDSASDGPSNPRRAGGGGSGSRGSVSTSNSRSHPHGNGSNTNSNSTPFAHPPFPSSSSSSSGIYVPNGIRLDDFVAPPTVLQRQLLDAVAEDAAIEDLYAWIGAAAADKRIDAEALVRETRDLARRQFRARYLAKKIDEALGEDARNIAGLHVQYGSGGGLGMGMNAGGGMGGMGGGMGRPPLSGGGGRGMVAEGSPAGFSQQLDTNNGSPGGWQGYPPSAAMGRR
jgi:hypothetical protein